MAHDPNCQDLTGAETRLPEDCMEVTRTDIFLSGEDSHGEAYSQIGYICKADYSRIFCILKPDNRDGRPFINLKLWETIRS